MIYQKKSHYRDSEFAGYLLDQEHGFYIENYFKEIVSLERKRAERSKKPFVLMLIDVEQIDAIDERRKIVNKIASILFHCTRETDTKGWFKKNSVIGIIFNELGDADIIEQRDNIYKKVEKKIHTFMDKSEVDNIKLDVYVYPLESNEPDHEKYSGIFFPDIKKKLSSDKVVNKIKRTIDIVGSLGGIFLFFPFFIAIPILIKLTSEGPVLFKQERVGLFGKKFTFLKFRSMCINNDDCIHREYITKLINEQKTHEETGDNGDSGNKKCIYKIQRDPRITLIGNFIRKTSLDELPQFFNVLRGDMSLVGPRPPILYECEQYDVWHKKRIFEVKPGITGLWQVKGRSSTTFNEMVRLDIQYIREWSFWLDFKLLFKTPWVLLTGKGAH